MFFDLFSGGGSDNREEIEEIEKEIRLLQTEINEWENDLYQFEEENTQLEKEIKNLKKKVALKNERGKSTYWDEKLIASKQRVIEYHKPKIKDIQKNIKAFKNELKQLEAKKKHLKGSFW